MSGITLTAEAKAAMITNLQLEIEARATKLRAMCDTQCASLRSRVERRVNRIPATKRDMPLVELLAPKPATKNVAKHEPSKATSTKTAPAKVMKAPVTKRAAPVPVPAPAPAPVSQPPTRRTRAPATSTTKVAPKPASTKAVPKAVTKATTTRGKKRNSDDTSGEDKENTALDVPRKRVRAVAPKAPAPSKPASTRTTRAASRQKAPAAQVLSPKNGNSRQKPAKSTTRPR